MVENFLHPGRRKNVPEVIRKNFQEISAWQALQACPAALALRPETGPWHLNPAARDILERLVSDQPDSWTRWLDAALIRLRASGSLGDTVASPRDADLGLRLRLADPALDGVEMLLLEEEGSGLEPGNGLADTVSTLSHELRTPLASMKSSLKLVLDGEAGSLNGDQSRFLAMTMRNINRLERLVGDLLDAARADAGQLNLKRQLVDAAQLVDEVVDNHREAARQAGLRLDSTGPEGPVPANLDGDKVVQMLGNLLSNALKYTPRGGAVRVRLEALAAPERIRLEVRDNGPGMDPNTAARVLKPFCRAQTADSSPIPGSGLGLHITARLAEAHGGRLGLETRLGQGTLVWVELPAGGHGPPAEIENY